MNAAATTTAAATEEGDGAASVATLVGALLPMLLEVRTVAVGANSPIPAAAALLAEEVSGGRVRPMILGSDRYGPFSDGGPELFDRAGQGRIDVFFLGGGQIDGEGNINLVGTGPYPRATTRLPGSFGSAYLYFVVPRVILFREEHSRRVLVPKVDFVSAPGWSPPGVRRTGGPHALLTGRALFHYERAARRFRLASVHPGHTADEVRAATGFAFDCPPGVAETAAPAPGHVALLAGPVRDKLATIYPEFARKRLPAP
jgi:glutaconate CoA-transferase subunit B